MLARLQSERLQSDARFAELFVQQRRDKGYGPLRIRRELQERGVDRDLIETHVDDAGHDWPRRLAETRQRKFGRALPGDYREQARQSRFLYQRGFSTEQIRALFRHGQEEMDA